MTGKMNCEICKADKKLRCVCLTTCPCCNIEIKKGWLQQHLNKCKETRCRFCNKKHKDTKRNEAHEKKCAVACFQFFNNYVNDKFCSENPFTQYTGDLTHLYKDKNVNVNKIINFLNDDDSNNQLVYTNYGVINEEPMVFNMEMDKEITKPIDIETFSPHSSQPISPCKQPSMKKYKKTSKEEVLNNLQTEIVNELPIEKKNDDIVIKVDKSLENDINEDEYINIHDFILNKIDDGFFHCIDDDCFNPILYYDLKTYFNSGMVNGYIEISIEYVKEHKYWYVDENPPNLTDTDEDYDD